jgi:hypothetical protein
MKEDRMSKPKVDHATPQIPETSQSAEKLFEDGTRIVTNVTASSALAGAPDVQTALKALGAANTALGTNNVAKAAGRLQLETAVTAEGPLVRRWGIRKRALVSAIEIAGDGSTELVAAFNVAVEQREPRPDAVVPVNLRPMKVARSTYASVRWDPTDGATGYMLQHATNPADATTYSPQIHVSAAKYRLAGTPGTTVYFRVLALDASLPLGQTAFTAWVAAIVAA